VQITPPASPPQTLLAGLLQALHALYPPALVVHVGAGRGQGELHSWRHWGVPQALLIDADEKRLEWASPQSLPTHWHAISATLSDQAAPADYHLASNPDEDGLLPPQHLNPLWPNLRTAQVETRHTRTLDDLLQQAQLPAPAHPAAWLIIDCLPALQILKGSRAALAQTQVVCVRVAQLGETPAAHILHHDAVTAYLAPLGLVPVAQVEGNHPALSHVLYARHLHTLIANNDRLNQANAESSTALLCALAQCDAEAKAKLEALNQRDQQTKTTIEAIAQCDLLGDAIAKLTADKDTLTLANVDAAAAHAAQTQARVAALAQRDAEAKAKVEAITQRDAESQAKTEALAQRDALTAEKAKLSADNASLTKSNADSAAAHAAETKARVAAVAQRDAEAKAKVEAITQRDALTKEKTKLITARDEQTALATTHQKSLLVQQHDATALQQRNQQLEIDNQQNAIRQQLLQEELIKAEAQIDLIKDLLLRELGL
jgi:hypothetical protein